MLTLCIRTDKPESEIYVYEDGQELAREVWQAHRQLGVTIHRKIDELLISSGRSLEDVQKIVVFSGPGSFTGLRIGVSVANAIARGLGVSVVGATGDEWIADGLQHDGSHYTHAVAPQYGRDPHVTRQKK